MIDAILISFFSVGGWYLFHAIIGWPDGSGYVNESMIFSHIGELVNKWSAKFDPQDINWSKPFWCTICGAVWVTILFIPIYSLIEGFHWGYIFSFSGIPLWKNLIDFLER